MKIEDALRGITHLALDSAPIIYLVENNLSYADRVEAVMDHIDDGSIVGVISTLTLAEALVLPKRASDPAKEQAFKDILLGRSDLLTLPVDSAVAETAATMRAKYGLRTPDAIQVATGIVNSCDALLTNDRGLRRVTELRIPFVDDLEL